MLFIPGLLVLYSKSLLAPNVWMPPILLSLSVSSTSKCISKGDHEAFFNAFFLAVSLRCLALDDDNGMFWSILVVRFFCSFAPPITDEHILNTFLSYPTCFRNNLCTRYWRSQGLHLVRPPPSTPPPQRLELLELLGHSEHFEQLRSAAPLRWDASKSTSWWAGWADLAGQSHPHRNCRGQARPWLSRLSTLDTVTPCHASWTADTILITLLWPRFARCVRRCPEKVWTNTSNKFKLNSNI